MSRSTSPTQSQGLHLMVAGGGTGGHLFPAIAIAEAFLKRNANNRVLFVSTGNAFEKKVLRQHGYELSAITVAGLKGRGLWHQLKALLKLLPGIWQSIGIIRRFQPQVVLGVGSYAAGPPVLSAWLMRRNIVLCEQNQVPGITNRMLARFARRIYVTFENTLFGKHAGKMVYTGNPIRTDIIEAARCTANRPKNEKEPFTVLVVGGSQGAHSINMAVIEALAHLQENNAIAFIHQTGSADEQQVAQAYATCGIQGRVGAFFDDMAVLYQQADLVICRAGATTVAELTALGKTAVFIPYPFAADNHQEQNARCLETAAAAEVIIESDLNGRVLADKIEALAADPARMTQMAAKAKTFGRPEATETIVSDLYQLVAR